MKVQHMICNITENWEASQQNNHRFLIWQLLDSYFLQELSIHHNRCDLTNQRYIRQHIVARTGHRKPEITSKPN